ncbi:hypothetical protein V5O48_015785 [Marasmius crinis-equi]|uniref:Uncharacterized protein n=1 Tax=Marasmius crinis-equi TaxID=585013 RepID=A0ABR3ETL7_9AGAR
MPGRNLSPGRPATLEGKGTLLRLEQRRVNKRAISVCRGVYRVMDVILVRKCRCTYVKFHRQTAPIGPGHNPNPTPTQRPGTASSSSSSVGSIAGAALIPGVYGHYPSHQPHHPPHPHAQNPYANPSSYANPAVVGYDDQQLLLGPAPGSIPNISGTGAVDPSSSTSSGSGYSGSFTFPPVYPRDERGYESDYATKYRVQAAELMRRGSLPSTSGSSGDWWANEFGGQAQGQQPYYGGSTNGMGVYGYRGAGAGAGANAGAGTDGESDSASASGTSSATSSSVHLPLDDHHHPQQYLLNGRHQSSSASPPSGVLHAHPSQHPPPHAQPAQDGSRPNTSHGFSNAFGLMSLDDPNVLAGLASDGQPFFSAFEGLEGFGSAATSPHAHAHAQEKAGDPNVTPMPRFTDSSPHQGTVALPGGGGQRPSTSGGPPPPTTTTTNGNPYAAVQTPREQETKELRDFWKAYMRTPLTGGAQLGANSVSPDVHMLSPGPSIMAAGYRRQRVSSLPSVKTPTDEGGGAGYYYGYAGAAAAAAVAAAKSNSNPNTGTNPLQYHQTLAALKTPQAGGGGGTMTGTEEDLRSYEAAVLARKAPTNLSLGPGRMRGRRKATNSPPMANANVATNGQHVSFVTPAGISRESSGSSGGTGVAAASVSTSPAKRRPSFKRLASQTLESGVEKRWREDDDEDGEDGSGEGSGDGDADGEDNDNDDGPDDEDDVPSSTGVRFVSLNGMNGMGAGVGVGLGNASSPASSGTGSSVSPVPPPAVAPAAVFVG